MKKLIFVLLTAMTLFSCQKEDPPTPATPTPTPTPTTVNRAFAINASATAFGGNTYGQLYVYIGAPIPANQVTQTGGTNYQIGTPAGSPGCVFYTFTVGTTYRMELSVGTSYQYKADVKFDANGNMTEEYADPTNTVSWVNSTAPNNPILFE